MRQSDSAVGLSLHGPTAYMPNCCCSTACIAHCLVDLLYIFSFWVPPKVSTNKDGAKGLKLRTSQAASVSAKQIETDPGHPCLGRPPCWPWTWAAEAWR
ncbi:hypothetical protein E2562_028362 [Oryza meyeriana var. granulata]|uniref:Uncharacterized protein n=1 Tax=Oryza meyeriana var. granulata TaxID=110450 RepID=A0A6G1DAH6_9ORYZ|nr:hypothetical protein E2562_028362 [Oryza meyeriana var. granulata]